MAGRISGRLTAQITGATMAINSLNRLSFRAVATPNPDIEKGPGGKPRPFPLPLQKEYSVTPQNTTRQAALASLRDG